MDKKVERANAEKVLRQTTKNLRALGFLRTKPTFNVRIQPAAIEFIHFHKYRHGPVFRVHLGIRIRSDPFLAVALNGPNSHAYSCPDSPNGKKYNFRFHETPETVQRCARNIQEFVTEVGEPWFAKWRNTAALVASDESPLSEEAKTALTNELRGETAEEFILKTNEMLKL